MSSLRLLIITVFVLVLGTGSLLQAEVVPGYDYVAGEILVKFASGMDASGKAEVMAPFQGAKVRQFNGIQVEHWKVGGDIEDVIAELEKSGGVVYAQPNYVLYALEVPDDPLFPDLWGLNNTGQTGGLADADIDAVEAWDVFTGTADVLIAVIDSGVDYTHPDLADNVWTNPGEIPGNGIDDDGNGYVDDIYGWDFANNDSDPMDDNDHGTHCSGTIGGTGNNGVGVTGVNWDVSIMGLKFLTGAGTGSTAGAISCIEYATLMGVDIMSNSWGGGPYDASLEAAISAANDADIFFVAAAGNSGTDNDSSPHYPSNYEVANVISVMATDHDDDPVNEPGWWATNYGATSVDIAAPGLHIWSTTPGNTYQDFSGTSMATPHVAGALGLLRGRFPNISVADGKNLLMTVGNDPLAILDGLCVSGSRLNVLKLIAEPDTIPPSTVTDLAAGTVASNWAEITWTAPGDDDLVGTASSYLVRWSLAPITDEFSWDAATPAAGAPDPSVSGTPEVMQVNDLDVLTTYYFCLRAKDEYGNLGGLSNNAMVTTLEAPTIDVTPLALSATLETGGTDTQTLTITNTGAGVLDFTIPSAEYLMPAKAGFGPVETWTYPATGKGQDIGIAPVNGTDGAGGPDAFGYNWRDSNEAGGPAFNWIEINTLGTSVSLSDDANSGPHAIGFDFDFYGNTFSEFYICSNGWISFTDSGDDMSNGPLPSSQAPSDLVALYWDDLNPATGGSIYYYNDGTRLIVEFEAVDHYDSGGVYTMQAHLYPNGVIEYHYLTIVDPSASATIGLQNSDGTDGLTTVFNDPYVTDNLAVRFMAITPWIQTSPNSGSLAAGASADVDVIFSATDLCGSSFDANLHVVSNDPASPDVAVAAVLNLIGTPDIQPDMPALDFGPVYITAQAGLDLTLTNGGCADLNITGFAFDNTDFTTTVTGPEVLGAGASLVVPVTFAPTAAGPLAGTLTVTSDDPDTPSLVIDLAGVGLEFPDIAVNPTELVETLPSGGTAQQNLTITNNGLGELNFTIPDADYVFTKSADALPDPNANPIELGKYDRDPRKGAEVLLGSGGPDVYGYTWTDSDEPGGPAFNWIEISGTGTEINFSGDDQNLGPHPIGFDFPFYGNDFSEFRACTNGWLSFTSTDNEYLNYALPSTSAPENLLAVFHDDLTFSSTGTAYYLFDGTRLIVQYQDAPRLSSGGPYTFQAHLYPSGRIEYHYLSMAGDRLDEATIGIQDGTQTDGLTVAFNAAYVHDNLAVRFQSVDPWLSFAPNAGTVAPGASVDIVVGFDSAGLCESQVLAGLHILSNDPDSPDVLVPVTMNLDGQPDAILSATDLDLGGTFLNQSTMQPLTIANDGCGTLEVSAVAFDDTVFTLDVAPPFSVGVGASAVVNVLFTPTVADTVTGVMTLTTNDPVTPLLMVNLTGYGINSGSVAINPGDLYQVVPTDGNATQSFTIENTGLGELAWTIPSPDLYTKHAAALGPVVKEPLPEASEGASDTEHGVAGKGTGGPDLYGYKWYDSDDPIGPEFDWIDISATGSVALSGGDHVNGGMFNIGFPFEFYGTVFTQFRVSSNGFITFTDTDPGYTNTGLPNASAPWNLIAPLWDDLDLNDPASGDVYYEVVDGSLVVMFDHVMPSDSGTSGGGPFTFEILLHPSGRMKMQYLTLNGNPASATVGIQDATGTVGLQVAYNSAYLHDNMAIEFRTPLNWLTCDPVTGVIPAGGSQLIEASFDAYGLELGLHEGHLRVQSDDPVDPELLMPVSLLVTDLSPVGQDVLPRVTALDQNVPNPFNPMTEIRFAVPKSGRVELGVYDLRGARVRTLVGESLEAGHHTRTWMGKDDQGRQVPSGVYFYRLRTTEETITRRMTLLK